MEYRVTSFDSVFTGSSLSTVRKHNITGNKKIYTIILFMAFLVIFLTLTPTEADVTNIFKPLSLRPELAAKKTYCSF